RVQPGSGHRVRREDRTGAVCAGGARAPGSGAAERLQPLGRALQYAFEEVMQISPVTYLRAMRLNQVRSELRQNRAAPVGDVAARWGFWHPSRFASDYKALFGELPSATRSAAAAREPLTA
ncbi:AraC family transcriptional regulator, partial [Hydrogenophaga aromaticivorans]|nr:AraC family transcriptional regulator [Hydrogenophaga aromaticivorans]